MSLFDRMLYFRDYHWLLIHGESQFHAYIQPGARKREDVTWFLNLHYSATGTAWRKVPWYKRPSLQLQISSFQSPRQTWRDLETLSFWNLPEDDEDLLPLQNRGFLDFTFDPPDDEEGAGVDGLLNPLWRVAARDGRWFTVEIAVLGDEYIPDELEKLPALVTPAGEEIPDDDSTARWKARAEVYLLESVPFGTVLVRTPRNARDAESFAIARAQTLIGGLDEPEHIQINDHSKWPNPKESLSDDIYVELHFNGLYQR